MHRVELKEKRGDIRNGVSYPPSWWFLMHRVELKELGSMNVRTLRRGQNHTDILQDAFYSVSFNNSYSKKDGGWEREIQAKIAQRSLKAPPDFPDFANISEIITCFLCPLRVY
jgi:hypothetical protein